MPHHMNGPWTGDAFGRALVDCLEAGAKAGAVTDIIERSDGYIDVGDVARYFAPPEQWGELDRWAIEHARGRVLDVGAGAGRHSLYLQTAGHDVVALDVSPLAAEVCRRRGCSSTFVGPVEAIAQTGVEPFDAFLLLGNNMGLLRDAAYAPGFLATLASIARRGASIIGTCLDPYVTENAAHLAYHAANRAAGRMGGQARIRFRYGRLTTEWMDYLFMSLEELGGLTAGSRWKLADALVRTAQYAVELRLRS